jgi:ribulose-5-phosphate 4-epimerase/fuculose-1-phosphate aldolase
MVISYTIFTFHEVGVRCAHFHSVIATIMDQKVQLLKSLNKRELFIFIATVGGIYFRKKLRVRHKKNNRNEERKTKPLKVRR